MGVVLREIGGLHAALTAVVVNRVMAVVLGEARGLVAAVAALL